MEIKRVRKDEFTVIGKLGSTAEGENFVNALWKKANEGFEEISSLVKCDAQGVPVGFWGLRSSLDTPLDEWKDGEGSYLAGLEVKNGSMAPMGWTKWVVPESLYLSVCVEGSIVALTNIFVDTASDQDRKDRTKQKYKKQKSGEELLCTAAGVIRAFYCHDNPSSSFDAGNMVISGIMLLAHPS